MANEIYLVTHDSLSNIISARAASRVLDRALKTKGYSSETISQQQMQDVLMGPVLKELQSILPSEGVKRTIQQITRQLEQELAKPVSSETLPTTEQEKNSKETASESFSLFNEEPTLAHFKPKPVEPKSEFSEKDVEALSLEFAQLEHAMMVATVRLSDGSVMSSRGAGFELESLSRLASLSLKLLQKNGDIRSYYLEESNHHLFLLPLGEYMLTLVGAAEMNVGAVFSKLSGIKEGV